MKLTQANFYSLLQAKDVEDSLCLWLYAKRGYFCIPSSNKLSTQLYECVLIDPAIKDKRIYIQIKKGERSLDSKDFSELNGEVYLLSTDGKVSIDSIDQDRIFSEDSKELFEFAVNAANEAYIPEGIRLWIQLLQTSGSELYES